MSSNTSARPPILVDIEPGTLNLSSACLADAIDRSDARGRLSPKAVIPVHYGGHPCDMDAIDALAARAWVWRLWRTRPIAFPAAVGDRMIGDPTAPDGVIRAVAFSFYATKNLTTAEGGMLTGPPDFIAEARLWSLHGMSRDAWKRYGQGRLVVLRGRAPRLQMQHDRHPSLTRSPSVDSPRRATGPTSRGGRDLPGRFR